MRRSNENISGKGDCIEEFFSELFPEELYAETIVRHSPVNDPLAAVTIDGVQEWQKQGKRYDKGKDLVFVSGTNRAPW